MYSNTLQWQRNYSEKFDRLRMLAIEASFYKYGDAKRNFEHGNVDAIATLKKCLEAFEHDGNTEHLIDVANYAMFRFMYPQNGEYYKATDSNGSVGIVGITEKEMERYKNGDY